MSRLHPRCHGWGPSRSALGRPMFRDRRAQISGVPLLQGPTGEIVCISVGVDPLRVYASSSGGASPLGLFVRIRNAPEYLVYCGAIDSNEGHDPGKSEVCLLFVFSYIFPLPSPFPTPVHSPFSCFLFFSSASTSRKSNTIPPKNKTKDGGKTRQITSPQSTAPTHKSL